MSHNLIDRLIRINGALDNWRGKAHTGDVISIRYDRVLFRANALSESQDYILFLFTSYVFNPFTPIN